MKRSREQESAESFGNITQLPCDVLLKIANSISVTDYARFSQVSNAIHRCLKSGRYTAAEQEEVEDLLARKRDIFREELQFIRSNAVEDIVDDPRFDYLSEEAKEELVHRQSYVIKYFKNPSLRLQLLALDRSYGKTYIKNPPLEIQREITKYKQLPRW